jgi:hypothetical protein
MISLGDFLNIPTVAGQAEHFFELHPGEQRKLPDAVLTAIHEHKIVGPQRALSLGGNGHEPPKSNGHRDPAEAVLRSYDDWLVAGQPALSYEQWSSLPSEEKAQFSLGEIREFAEDGHSDWAFDQRQAAERYIVDYERESITKDWDDPVPSKKFIGDRQRSEQYDRQILAPIVLRV